MSAHLLKEKGGSENSSTRLKLRKDEANTLWATDACENHLFPRRPCYSVTMRTIDKSNIRKKRSHHLLVSRQLKQAYRPRQPRLFQAS